MAKVRAKRAVPVRFFKAKMWEGVKPPKEKQQEIKRMVLIEHYTVVNTVTVTSTGIYVDHVHVLRLYMPFHVYKVMYMSQAVS